MRQGRVVAILLWVLVTFSLVLLALYYLALSAYYGSFFWFSYLFPHEPRVQQIAELSAANPQLRLPDLLDARWDYVCFLYPYYPVELDPKMAGAEIPWINDDGIYTVVLKRDAVYDVQQIDRGQVIYFQTAGLADGEACYDSTDVVLEYVEGDGPVTVRVTPQN